jgi:hypothetical protein
MGVVIHPQIPTINAELFPPCGLVTSTKGTSILDDGVGPIMEGFLILWFL